MLSKTGEIRRDEACLDYSGTDVILYPCHGSKGNQFWEYDHEVCHLVTLGDGVNWHRHKIVQILEIQLVGYKI